MNYTEQKTLNVYFSFKDSRDKEWTLSLNDIIAYKDGEVSGERYTFVYVKGALLDIPIDYYTFKKYFFDAAKTMGEPV